MKLTLSTIEKRIEALENAPSINSDNLPVLHLFLHGADSERTHVHIFARDAQGRPTPEAGIYVLPCKMTPEVWNAQTTEWRAQHKSQTP